MGRVLTSTLTDPIIKPKPPVVPKQTSLYAPWVTAPGTQYEEAMARGGGGYAVPSVTPAVPETKAGQSTWVDNGNGWELVAPGGTPSSPSMTTSGGGGSSVPVYPWAPSPSGASAPQVMAPPASSVSGLSGLGSYFLNQGGAQTGVGKLNTGLPTETGAGKSVSSFTGTGQPVGGGSGDLVPGRKGKLSDGTEVTVDAQGRLVDSDGFIRDPETEKIIGSIYGGQGTSGEAESVTPSSIPTPSFIGQEWNPTPKLSYMAVPDEWGDLVWDERKVKEPEEPKTARTDEIVNIVGPDGNTYTVLQQTSTIGDRTYNPLPEKGYQTGTTKVWKDGQITDVPWKAVDGKKVWANGENYEAVPTPMQGEVWTTGKNQGRDVYGLAGTTKEGGAMNWVDPNSLQYLNTGGFTDRYGPDGFLYTFDSTTGEPKKTITYDPMEDVTLQAQLAEAKTDNERQDAVNAANAKYNDAQLELERQRLAQSQMEWAYEHPALDTTSLGGGILSRQAFDALPAQMQKAWLTAWASGAQTPPPWYQFYKSGGSGNAPMGSSSWVAARQY